MAIPMSDLRCQDCNAKLVAAEQFYSARTSGKFPYACPRRGQCGRLHTKEEAETNANTRGYAQPLAKAA